MSPSPPSPPASPPPPRTTAPSPCTPHLLSSLSPSAHLHPSVTCAQPQLRSIQTHPWPFKCQPPTIATPIPSTIGTQLPNRRMEGPGDWTWRQLSRDPTPTTPPHRSPHSLHPSPPRAPSPPPGICTQPAGLTYPGMSLSMLELKLSDEASCSTFSTLFLTAAKLQGENLMINITPHPAHQEPTCPALAHTQNMHKGPLSPGPRRQPRQCHGNGYHTHPQGPQLHCQALLLKCTWHSLQGRPHLRLQNKPQQIGRDSCPTKYLLQLKRTHALGN